jgi:hypothetical protein
MIHPGIARTDKRVLEKTDRHKKKPNVMERTTRTQGRNSLSLSQWFPVTRLPYPPSKNDQNNNEPA